MTRTIRGLALQNIPARLLAQGSQAPEVDLEAAFNNLRGALRIPTQTPQVKAPLPTSPSRPELDISQIDPSAPGGCVLHQERPALRKRRNIPDIKFMDGANGNGIVIPAGSKVFDTFIADATETWNTAASRKFLHGKDSPRELHSVWGNEWLLEVDPVLEVQAFVEGGVFSRELSEELTRMWQGMHALILDPNGKGKELKLDPMLIEDFPVGGIKLDRDQYMQMTDDAFARFDYFGTGELADYAIGDVAFDQTITIVVKVGVKAVFSETTT